MKKPKLGATGEFPRGKFAADDEGQLRIAITTKDNTVIIHFGKEVAWIGMSKPEAKEFAKVISQHAEQK
jgi:hypothetical protein